MDISSDHQKDHHVRDHSYISSETLCPDNNNEEEENHDQNQQQCFYITSTTEPDSADQLSSLSLSGGNKYKNHIMEKYLRDCQKPLDDVLEKTKGEEDHKPPILSKWLESAAKFRPSQNNYLNWTFGNGRSEKKSGSTKNKTNKQCEEKNSTTHGREELDAAEALTRLANVHAIKL